MFAFHDVAKRKKTAGLVLLNSVVVLLFDLSLLLRDLLRAHLRSQTLPPSFTGPPSPGPKPAGRAQSTRLRGDPRLGCKCENAFFAHDSIKVKQTCEKELFLFILTKQNSVFQKLSTLSIFPLCTDQAQLAEHARVGTAERGV